MSTLTSCVTQRTVPMPPLKRYNKEQYVVGSHSVRESMRPLNMVLDLPLED